MGRDAALGGGEGDNQLAHRTFTRVRLEQEMQQAHARRIAQYPEKPSQELGLRGFCVGIRVRWRQIRGESIASARWQGFVHLISGQETPAFRHGEEWPSPLFCATLSLSRRVTASNVLWMATSASSSGPKPEPGYSGWRLHVNGLGSPTLVVNQPPDANRVGEA